MSSESPILMEENSPPPISLEGHGFSSVAPELDPRRGAFVINTNGAVPTTVRELTATTVEALKSQYDDYVRQNPAGCAQHPSVYLAVEARRILNILCKSRGGVDYSDADAVRQLTTDEWFKRVLVMLNVFFPSEKEESNLVLRSLAGYVGWVQKLAKYFEEGASLSDSGALSFTLECLVNFTRERNLLRAAMNNRAKDQRTVNKSDIIAEVMTILHTAKLYEDTTGDRKRPAYEQGGHNQSAKRRAFSPTTSFNRNFTPRRRDDYPHKDDSYRHNDPYGRGKFHHKDDSYRWDDRERGKTGRHREFVPPKKNFFKRENQAQGAGMRQNHSTTSAGKQATGGEQKSAK